MKEFFAFTWKRGLATVFLLSFSFLLIPVSFACGTYDGFSLECFFVDVWYGIFFIVLFLFSFFNVLIPFWLGLFISIFWIYFLVCLFVFVWNKVFRKYSENH
jgi:hypothetical protein